MINLASVKQELFSMRSINVERISENSNFIIVCFCFEATVEVNGAEFDLDNKINIEIPKNYPLELPIVFENGEKQIKNFPHINPDVKGTFCLGTNIDIQRRLKPDYSLVKYIHLIAEFLGTYKYYNRYGNFPYGDRSHGVLGIVETYEELFSVATKQQILDLMKIDKLKNRDRNKKCPCNSGKKFKNCHWGLMTTILRNPLERTQLKQDYRRIFGGGY